MILTKEQCLYNLKALITRGGNDDEFLRLYPHFKYEIDYIFKLIDEHFDNPPLKFEELEEGMWVWDNKEKCYFQCNPRISNELAQCVTYYCYWCNDGKDYDDFIEEFEEFEENRFYRKQVEE